MARKILIIDDEERIREVVRACLEDLAGWRTWGAASGLEGLAQARLEQPDAILLDVAMPAATNGLEILAAIKADSLIQTIPVILLTAKGRASDRAHFAQLDIAGVIYKPFNPLSLSTQVAQILGWVSRQARPQL
ncbi:response regulator [Almyronema epifaneia]|uniref:Response regulator n=1 Tax=Almyronema epifaneia S1 TaxID=2991925 RepID=A0ABW6II65_9CYAN